MPLLVQELDVEAAVLTRDSILAPAQEVEIDANGDGHVSKKAARAAARRCQPPAVTPSMDQINQILNTLGLTLADVKISVDGDTTTVQMFESVASLADVKEAVSAGGGSGIVTDVSNGEVIVYPPSPPPPSPPPLPPPSPSQPPPTPPPPSACSNPCRKNADGIQLTCLHWSDLSLKVACIYTVLAAPHSPTTL